MQRTQYTPAPEYLETLKRAIREAHGLDATHDCTWMGVEYVGHLMWSGSVEIFKAKAEGEGAQPTIFAWSRVVGTQMHCYVVLAGPGTETPRQAVRQVLEEQTQEEEGASKAA